jgi:hypothetical protein
MKKFLQLLAMVMCLLPAAAWAAVPPDTVPPSSPAARAASREAVPSKGTLLFVPLDDRPVCKAYTADTLRKAGWDVQMPPEEYISSSDRGGNPEKLFEWLDANAHKSIAMVVSADALIYGGLVDSRTHHTDVKVLLTRTNRLLDLKASSNSPNLYAFVTVMRSPKASAAPVEPAYYGTWGPKIFRRGQLLDKEDLGTLKNKEQKELAALNKEIPADVQKDLDNRRETNLDITKILLSGVQQNRLDYLLVGRDDTATFSQAHMDARHIEDLVNKLPDKKVRFFAGADQLGLILLDRAVNTLTYTTPLVYAFYADGKGGATIPSYEDEPIANTVKHHIMAAGAYPVTTDKRADLVMGVFTPKDGKTFESGNIKNNGLITAHESNFTGKVEKYLDAERPVAVADVAFGNGSSTALVKDLAQEGVAYKLAAYGGWNTASNSMGMALGQALLAGQMSTADRIDLLNVRYLEDWGYQSLVRTKVYQEIIWPQNLPGSMMKPAEVKLAETAITTDMLKATKDVLGPVASYYNFTLPWKRMFEVYVTAK